MDYDIIIGNHMLDLKLSQVNAITRTQTGTVINRPLRYIDTESEPDQDGDASIVVLPVNHDNGEGPVDNPVDAPIVNDTQNVIIDEISPLLLTSISRNDLCRLQGEDAG
jgi:hypothetical protein